MDLVDKPPHTAITVNDRSFFSQDALSFAYLRFSGCPYIITYYYIRLGRNVTTMSFVRLRRKHTSEKH